MSHIEQLILVPTVFEQDHLGLSSGDGLVIECCGFGPIVASARAALLIAKYQPRQVLLLGIAGRLSEQLCVGQAYEFGRVTCFGVGAGSGVDFLSAEEMGWQQWPGNEASPPIIDSIEFAPVDRTLLTCPTASGTPNDASSRRARHPAALAEDMEGFAVAVACRLCNVPLRIVRGISNDAGDRDKSRWEVEVAMQSVSTLATELLNP